MKKMATALLLLLLLGIGSTADAQVSFGFRIGPPPPPRVVRILPRRPGPGFVWINGYWYPTGNHYSWHNGYWARPPYAGARWIVPQYRGGAFYAGRWDGGHARIDHGRQWDRGRNQDYRHSDHR